MYQTPVADLADLRRQSGNDSTDDARDALSRVAGD